jgi:hypothetical protein
MIVCMPHTVLATRQDGIGCKPQPAKHVVVDDFTLSRGNIESAWMPANYMEESIFQAQPDEE